MFCICNLQCRASEWTYEHMSKREGMSLSMSSLLHVHTLCVVCYAAAMLNRVTEAVTQFSGVCTCQGYIPRHVTLLVTILVTRYFVPPLVSPSPPPSLGLFIPLYVIRSSQRCHSICNLVPLVLYLIVNMSIHTYNCTLTLRNILFNCLSHTFNLFVINLHL